MPAAATASDVPLTARCTIVGTFLYSAPGQVQCQRLICARLWQALFQAGMTLTGNRRAYPISKDGKRFLTMLRNSGRVRRRSDLARNDPEMITR